MLMIDEKLAQGILNYLAEKPYKEAAGLIQEILKLKPIEVKKNEENEEDS